MSHARSRVDYACSDKTPIQTTRKHQNRKVLSSEARLAKQCWLWSEDAGETVALVSRTGVSAILCSSAPLPACLHSHTALVLAISLHSRRACAHTPHCRRVSLALRISSECTVDACAEINAAAPPDQQRFPVSCEVTGLRSEKRYRLRPKLRCLPLFPPAAVGRLRQEKPTLGSALIHGETFVWSANITAKQVKYRVILWF